MPGTRCTVAVCNNSFEKTKRAGMKIMYHQFPKSQPLRNIWIEKCRRAGNWNPNSCHVCSIHFTEDDYRRDLSVELLKIPGKRRLKSTAVPSLFLTEPPPLLLTSLAPRKRKKLTVDDETMYINENETIYLQFDNTNNQDVSTHSLPIYEFDQLENSNERFSCLSDYENNHIETIDKGILDSYYEEMQENKNRELKDKKLPVSSRVQGLTSIDRSTQTEPDYFFDKYKKIISENENLEKELDKWHKKYRKLMSNMKFLETKIQRLTLHSGQTEQS